MPIVALATDIGVRNTGQPLQRILCRAAWANPYVRLALTPAVLEAALLANLGIDVDIDALAQVEQGTVSGNGVVRTFWDQVGSLWALEIGGDISAAGAGVANTPTVPQQVAFAQEQIAVGAAHTFVASNLPVTKLIAGTVINAGGAVANALFGVGAPAISGDVQVEHNLGAPTGTFFTLAADAATLLDLIYEFEDAPEAPGVASTPTDLTLCTDVGTEYGGVDLSAAANHPLFVAWVTLA